MHKGAMVSFRISNWDLNTNIAQFYPSLNSMMIKFISNCLYLFDVASIN